MKNFNVIFIDRGQENCNIPKIPGEKLKSAKEAYIQSIYICNQSFPKSSSWWFTPLSSREWYDSEIQKMFQFSYNYERYLRIKKLHKIHLSANSIFQTQIIKSIGEKYGYKVIVSIGLLYESYLLEIQQFLRNIKSMFYGILWLFILSIRSLFIKTNSVCSIDEVFISPYHNERLTLDNSLNFDHYFGELPLIYFDGRQNVELLGVTNAIYKQKTFFKDRNVFIISPILDYWSYRDFLFFLIYSVKEFFLPPKINFNFSLPGLSSQINREVRKYYWNRIIARAYEYSFNRYLNLKKPNVVFHTYENNWWERAINRACMANPAIVKKQVGYLHCAILDSHLKYTIINDEWILKPSPNEILTTGPVASEILLGRGNYSAEKIRFGYDLRGPNLLKIKQKGSRPSSIKHILLLLEGLNTMPSFLRLVLESIGKLEFHLYIRCHPVFPIEKSEFKEIREHSLFSSLTISRGKTLDEDLQLADLVIYKGTTSALYAGYKGIPMLKYADNWWASDDPLDGCSSFKKKFSNSIELLGGIQYFNELSDELYSSEKIIIQNYVFNYMRPYKNSELNELAINLKS